MNALQVIQQRLKAPKSQYNSFGKYHYRNQEDILEAVKPLLTETGAYLVIWDDVVEVGGHLFVKSTATLGVPNDDTSLADNTWSAVAYAKHDTEIKGMSAAQITGAASSYARKYALNGLFLIDDAKDADATNDGAGKKKVENATAQTKTEQPPTTKKEWLNPGTPAWETTLKRIKEGAKIEEIEKIFLISKANKTKLTDESK